MKTWIKATIVALLAIFSSSCTIAFDEDEHNDAYYLFEGKTWSRIIETHGYEYFVCYDFYRDGSYTYWFLEDDGKVTYSIESGRWDVEHHGFRDEITLWYNGGSSSYDVDEFLEGLSEHNPMSTIDAYKRDIDDLYHHH